MATAGKSRSPCPSSLSHSRSFDGSPRYFIVAELIIALIVNIYPGCGTLTAAVGTCLYTANNRATTIYCLLLCADSAAAAALSAMITAVVVVEREAAVEVEVL